MHRYHLHLCLVNTLSQVALKAIFRDGRRMDSVLLQVGRIMSEIGKIIGVHKMPKGREAEIVRLSLYRHLATKEEMFVILPEMLEIHMIEIDRLLVIVDLGMNHHLEIGVTIFLKVQIYEEDRQLHLSHLSLIPKALLSESRQ
jgi:hypothetical protein